MVVPGAIAVSKPAGVVTLATVGVLLVQPPPLIASVSDSVWPTHIGGIAVNAGGCVFTVTVVIALQPVGNVYVILVTPVATPVTTPDTLPMVVATDVLALVHVPPVGVDTSVLGTPVHRLVGVGVIGVGAGFRDTATGAE